MEPARKIFQGWEDVHQSGFAALILRMRPRNSRAIGGRPGFDALFFLQ